jgi:hypothetical protein
VQPQPERHGGIALVPITHSIERSVAEIEWLAAQPGIRGRHGPDHVARPRALQPPGLRPGVGGLPGRRLPRPHPLGGGAQEEYNDNIGIYLAEVVWWAARPMWHLLFSGVFERFPASEVRGHRGGRLLGADMMWKWDQYMGGGHTTKKMAALLARGRSPSCPRTTSAEHLHRRVHHVQGGDPPSPFSVATS